MVASRLRKTYSKAEWEFRAVRVAEVSQSAIYVRRLGGAAGASENGPTPA